MPQFKFNATQVAPSAAMEVLPEGTYPVRIVQSTLEENSAKTGGFIHFVLEVEAGNPHAGRKLHQRLNVFNPSEKAVEIAQAELSAICHAVGVLNLETTEQLHGRPFYVRVIVSEGPKGKTNEVRGVAMSPQDQPASPPWGAPPSAAPAAPHAAAQTPPWGAPGAQQAPQAPQAPQQPPPPPAPPGAQPPWGQQAPQQPPPPPAGNPPPWGQQPPPAGNPPPWGQQPPPAGNPPPWGQQPPAQGAPGAPTGYNAPAAPVSPPWQR